jgi:hypothetical protein
VLRLASSSSHQLSFHISGLFASIHPHELSNYHPSRMRVCIITCQKLEPRF